MVERAAGTPKDVLAFQPVDAAHAPAQPRLLESLSAAVSVQPAGSSRARNLLWARLKTTRWRVSIAPASRSGGLVATREEPGRGRFLHLSARSIVYPRVITRSMPGSEPARLRLNVTDPRDIREPRIDDPARLWRRASSSELQLRGVALRARRVRARLSPCGTFRKWVST